jgi:hypothetical protein
VQLHRRKKFLTPILFSLSGLLLCPIFSGAQNAPQPSAPNPPPSSDPSPDVRALSDAVRSLQDQVQALTTQLNQMRAEQAQDREEARQLRRQLAASSSHDPAQPAPAVTPGPATNTSAVASTNSASPAAPNQDQPTSDALNKIQEDVQLIDAKVNDQYQTKVESGSKYRLRLSGIVLLNLFDDRGGVDNLDFPSLAEPPEAPYQTNAAFGGTVRQSQISLQAFGPDIAGAHTSADITFDFAGGFPDTPNGDTMGLVRLRTGTIRFDWGDTSIIAGQDALFLSPLAPTSLATLAVPPLSYSGNLWSWSPQIRVEHQIHLTESSALHFQFGILDSLTGDIPEDSFERYPEWGEQSGQPAYAARIAWSHRFFGRDLTAGIGGYYGRQTWEFDHHVDGWAGTTDLTVPLGQYFDFSGEFYRGRAVGGLGGGVGQTTLFTGPFTSATTGVYGLNSMGGWTQLKFKPWQKFQFNGGFGQDNPFASQINLFPAADNTSYYGALVERNRSAFINFIYQPRSDVLLGLEYRRLRTFYFGAEPQSANHVNMSVGYIF